MTNVASLPVPQGTDASAIMARVLLLGDLSKLTEPERVNFYMSTCSSLGLNPLTRPFDYIRLNGKEVLYAKRDAADQLRKINRISLEIVDRKVTGDLLVVTVRATTPDGRSDEDMGAVSIKGLQGEALANAMLKAMTKAKRRVTLSICGLGMLDESEVRSAVEQEALAGPVDLTPRQRAIAAPAAPMPASAPPATFTVAVPYGGEAATYPRTRGGAREAFREIVEMFNEGHRDVIHLNNAILDEIADRVPALADEISELRAAAAEALADDEPGALDPEALDAFGLPPLRPAEEVLPTDPPD